MLPDPTGETYAPLPLREAVRSFIDDGLSDFLYDHSLPPSEHRDLRRLRDLLFDL